MIKYKGYKKKYQLAGDLVGSNILPTHTVTAKKPKVNHTDPTKSDYIPNFQVANDNWKSQQSVNTPDVYTNPQVKNDNIQQFKPSPQPTVKPVNTQGTITQGDSKVFEDNLYNNLRDNKTFNNLSDRLIIPTVNLMGGLELGALAKPLLKQVGKYAVTKTPLKNTYKLNPWAFKPNLESYYHRSPDIKNLINREKGIIQGFGQSEEGKIFNLTAGPGRNPNGGINLKKSANDELYFSKGVPLDYGRYNSSNLKMSGQGYPGPYIIEINNVPMVAKANGKLTKVFNKDGTFQRGIAPNKQGSYAVATKEIPLSKVKFYKEDWLKGYKEILNKQYMSGGIIGTETFNVGNPGNREVKGSLSNKGKVIKGKKSNKITVASGQLRQYAQSVRAKYGMTLDDYVDKAKEENPNIKLTMTPGQWLINPTENNEDAVNNDKKFNLMVQSSNVNVDLKGLHDIQSVYDNTISNFKKSIGNPDEENLDYWINSLFVPEAAKLKKQYPNDDLTFDKALKLTYDRYKYSQNNKGLHEGKDIATTHNNPGNIKYGEFAVKYGATPGKKATDGGVFAVFPSIEAGEEARRGLLRYGKNYRNLTVDEALKRWSNNGYNGSIVPHLAGLKIKDLTDDQFNQLSAAQIRSESNAMFNKLNKQYVTK